MSLSGFIPFVFVSVCAQDAVAQASATQTSSSFSSIILDAGAIYAQQWTQEAIGAGVVSLQARRATAHSAFSAAALLIGSADSSTAMQGTLGAEFALPKQPSLRLELSGTATTFGALSKDEGGSRDGYVRPQFARTNYGLFGTLRAGTVHRNRVGQHALAWDVGSWMRRGMFAGVLLLRQSFTNDSLLMEASNIVLSRNAHHYAVQDVQGTVSTRVSRFELLASAAWRNGVGATTGRGRAFFASITTGLTSRLALVINGGTQLAEPLSGVPAAKVIGASLRVHMLGRAEIHPTSQMPAVPRSTPSTFSAQIDRHATGGATVTVRVDAPAGARVELAGSFNDWVNLPMRRTGNAFELAVELPRGMHRVAVRVNGGEWRAPNGLARVKDDLGGEAGIVVVP